MMFEVCVDPAPIEPIAFQSDGRLRRGPGHLEIAGITESDHCPVAFRGIPVKRAVVRHSVRNVDDFLASQ